MDLRPYVETIHQQLALAAEAGGEEARALAERLTGPLDAAMRLALQDVLAAAAEEITCELAPGSVELRLRGRDPEFVVSLPVADAPAGQASDAADEPGTAGWLGVGPLPPGEAEEGGMARINLRLPEQLKARVENAATQESLSVNAWLVRAAAAAVQHTDPTRRHAPRAHLGSQHFTGWAR